MASLRALFTLPGCTSKASAALILFEAIFAAIIGTLFAVAATGGYDAIANCIGVLFIHDTDEKAFEAFGLIEADKMKERKCCGPKCKRYGKTSVIFITSIGIMVLSLIVGGSIRAAQVQQVIEEYGEDYWDNWSDFTWDSSWGSWWSS